MNVFDLNRRENEARNLEHQLKNTPATIRVATPMQWPYTVEHHRKSGALEGSLRITNAVGTLLDGGPLTKAFLQRDDAVTNANPAIGLQSRTPQFPDDETIRRTLLDAAADDCATRILQAVLGQRIQEFRTAATRAAAEGKPHAEFDDATTAALLLFPIDPVQANKQFRELREKLKAQ